MAKKQLNDLLRKTKSRFKKSFYNIRSLFILTILGLVYGCVNISSAQNWIINEITPEYQTEENPKSLTPQFTGKDVNRSQILVSLEKVAEGFSQITDLQFFPESNHELLVLEKTGALKWVNLSTNQSEVLHLFEVTTKGEQGLLGLAFHPKYLQNGKIYVNRTLKKEDRDISRVSEWFLLDSSDISKKTLMNERIIMEVVQPYSNHNAGALSFDPDGMLFVGWGDGGWTGDPKENGQNGNTWLGSMLRINVNEYSIEKPYAIPPDNPFVNNPTFQPETWAIGFRNPWKYTFTAKGQLVLADVGQNQWEEVNIVERGGNFGWNIREAKHCFIPRKNCPTAGLVDPIYEYDHTEGVSITGGYVYEGKIIELKNKYLFGDFVTGRIWAFDMPATTNGKVSSNYSLGKWPLLISTFGQDHDGEVYIGDFANGTIYRIAPAISGK